MNTRSRKAAVISTAAALAALMMSGQSVHAADLTFDDTSLQDDGAGGKYGIWDTSTANWLNGTTPTTWSNATPDSATFGNTTNAFKTATPTNNIVLGGPITVQNLTIGIAPNGGTYNVSDALGGGPLTLAGNITKTAGNGFPTLGLDNTGLVLTSGDHTFTINDSPGDSAPELTVSGPVSGSGNIVIDNGASYPAWGTTAFLYDNSYTGTTTITKGRLVVTRPNGLGSTSAGTVIQSAGSLSIGGGGVSAPAGFTLNEPVTITRDTYTGGDFGLYPAALIFANAGGAKSYNLSATTPVTIDSADGRISVNTNTLVVPAGSIVYTPAAQALNAVVSFTGDTAGFVQLQGSNPQFAATGVKLVNGVEVSFESDDSLGGASAPITFAGGAYLDLTGHPAMTTFGTHVINTASFGGGLDVPAGQSFTVDRALSGGSGLAKRGTGSLTINSSVSGNGNIFWDGGQIDVNAPVTFATLHTRSPVININNGGSITLTGGNWISFGSDSTGTNGGPDITTVNISGNGQLNANTGNDFNLSDNNNTRGTINLADNGVLSSGGVMFIGKSTGATGTINQTGGTLNSNRSGNFGFVLGDGRGPDSPVGIYNLSGGTFTANGEVYVGEGGSNAVGGARGHGFWTQTAGTVTYKNWFVVGRESAVGTYDISGGTVTQTGGNMSLGDSGAGGEADTINIHGTASITTTGELYIGNNGGNITNATLADTASVTGKSWLVVGRSGGTGTLNMTGGTLTQQNANWFDIGANGTGTVNLSGGTINALQMYIGENGTGNGTLNINGGAVNITNNAVFANANTATGALNLNAGTLTAFGFTANNGNGTGKGTFTFNGGTLRANADNANFVGAKVASVVSAGGAKIDTNGHNVTYNSALTHDAALSGADGGLTKSGSGLLKLTGADTYTGNTNVLAGTLQAAKPASLPAFANPAQTVISPGATLAFNVGGSGEFATSDVTTVLGSGVLVPGTTLGVDTSNATSPVTYSPAISNSIGLTKLGGGSLVLTGANTYNGVTTANGTGSLVLTQPAWAPVLSTGGGALVNGGKLVFDYTGTTSPVSTVAALLKSSHDSANFTDPSQRIRTANANDATHGLGYYDNGSSTVTVLYTWYGDVNLDGIVNADDYALIDRGAAMGSTGWVNGDLNYDGVVNSSDYLLADTSYGKIRGVLSPDFLSARQAEFGDSYVASLVAAVPEPGVACLAGLAAVVAPAVRRRRAR